MTKRNKPQEDTSTEGWKSGGPQASELHGKKPLVVLHLEEEEDSRDEFGVVRSE